MRTTETHLESVLDELKNEVHNDINSMRNDINSLRTWVISLFLGSIGIMTGIVILGINAIQLIHS